MTLQTAEEKAIEDKKTAVVAPATPFESDTNPFAESEVTEKTEQEAPSGGGSLSLSELPIRELYIRRGGSIGIAVTFLIIGIFLRVSIPLPHS